GPGRRIQVTSRVGPNGRDLKLPQGSSDRTTGPQHGPFNLLSVLSDAPAPSWRLQYLWPGRRIGLCWQASRLLISPVSTRRRISARCSMSVYTPASCRTASDHGCDHHRTAGAASERYTSGSAAGTSASAALLDRRLHQVSGKDAHDARLVAAMT